MRFVWCRIKGTFSKFLTNDCQTRHHSLTARISPLLSESPDGVHLEDHPGEQAVMAVARALHSAGLSSRQVAAGLAARGLYRRTGMVFTPSAILNMVVS